jgi:hypothetical protein
MDHNDIATYWLTKFVKNPPDRNKKILEFSNNRILIEKELDNLRKYLCIDSIRAIESIPGEYKKIDDLVYTLKIFVKTRIWNKVVSILYGKDYKSNPLQDSRKITRRRLNPISDESIETTTGKVFSLLWEDIDSYCDNAVEFMATDQIDDTLRDIIILGGEITRDILIESVAIGLIALTIETPLAPIGVTAAAESTLIVSKYLSKFQKVYSKILDITPAVVRTYNKLLSDPKTILSIGGIQVIVDNVVSQLKEEPEIKAMGISNISDKLEQGHEDKNAFISKVKSRLESHTDFKKTWDWNINSDFYRNLESMPNWSNWNKTEGKNIKPEQFGYIITYYISLYCWQFQEYVIYYNWLKKLPSALDDMELAKKQKNEVSPIDLKTINKTIKASPPDATSISSKKY